METPLSVISRKRDYESMDQSDNRSPREKYMPAPKSVKVRNVKGDADGTDDKVVRFDRRRPRGSRRGGAGRFCKRGRGRVGNPPSAAAVFFPDDG